MTLPQALAFLILAGMVLAFMLGRWRYDVVAVGALLIALAVGALGYAWWMKKDAEESPLNVLVTQMRTRAIIEHGADVVVLTTGIGFRGWLETAEAAGLGSAVADPNGWATLYVPNVPSGLTGSVVFLQAAVVRGQGGVDSVLSAVQSFTVF